VLDMGRLHKLPGQSMLSASIADEQDSELLTNSHYSWLFVELESVYKQHEMEKG